ncbi:MAG: response regulator, partial [Desulfotignum sp.]|nr:response regulator [Desulfotignum sp.]
LIHLMDGDIWVESESGSGSTFYFTIRLKTATQNAVRQVLGKGLESAALSFETPVTPLHILLAEDFEVNRKLLEPFLAQHGHDVTSVENGEQALEMLSQQPFDMVLMDIKMPVMDGIEATRRIRQHTDVDISRIPVIALTAHAIKGDRERFLAAGMDEYVTKPIHGNELLMMMERLAKKRKETGRSQEPVDKKLCSRSHALQLMGGNEDIVDAVIKTMIIRFPEEIEKIRAAIEKQDFDTVTMAAHAMKSGLKSIDAIPVLACVEQVETAGKSQDHARCQALMRSLEPLFEELVRQLGGSLPFSKPDDLG